MAQKLWFLIIMYTKIGVETIFTQKLLVNLTQLQRICKYY